MVLMGQLLAESILRLILKYVYVYKIIFSLEYCPREKCNYCFSVVCFTLNGLNRVTEWYSTEQMNSVL